MTLLITAYNSCSTVVTHDNIQYPVLDLTDFPQISTDLIWLLLAGDLWVSKSEGLLCFLFTGSEQKKHKANG